MVVDNVGILVKQLEQLKGMCEERITGGAVIYYDVDEMMRYWGLKPRTEGAGYGKRLEVYGVNGEEVMVR